MPGPPESTWGGLRVWRGLFAAELISLPSSPASAVEPDSHHPLRGLEVKVSPSDEQGN